MVLDRVFHSDQGTFGLLRAEGFSCWISELPWRDNRKQLSCIPEGIYTCVWHRSPKFGDCYKLLNVPNRNAILIHAGNFAGDSTLGYKTHSNGCLLPAAKIGILDGQKAGLLSRPTTLRLYSHFQKEAFSLEIRNAYIHSRLVG